MDLFVSYTSDDRNKLAPILDGLRRQHTVWLDRELSGGQEWWDTILARIRACDAMLLALSPAVLDSVACGRETDYGRALGKPILPVMIDPVMPELLPPLLASIQIVDFTQPGSKSAFDLIDAVSLLPSKQPLPDPLPAPPPVPISYLSSLSEQVQAPELTRDEQWSLVGKLREGIARPRDRGPIVHLMRRLSSREDLYHGPAQQLADLLATVESMDSDAVHVPAPTEPAPDPGRADRYRAWHEWALQEFGQDKDRAAAATEAAIKALDGGADSTQAAAAAIDAVSAAAPSAQPVQPVQLVPRTPPAPAPSPMPAPTPMPTPTLDATPGSALAAIGLGLVSLVGVWFVAWVGLLAGLGALFFGWRTLDAIKKGKARKGSTQAWIGIGAGGLGVVLAVATVLFYAIQAANR